MNEQKKRNLKKSLYIHFLYNVVIYGESLPSLPSQRLMIICNIYKGIGFVEFEMFGVKSANNFIFFIIRSHQVYRDIFR
jgi:hypothetical protein